jgi:hypothetical protein
VENDVNLNIGDNNLTVVIIQTQKARMLSRLTLEYFDFKNELANEVNLSFVEALTDGVRKFASSKAQLS